MSTSTTRRIRGSRRRRSFDLRATAVYFALLALLLVVLGFVVRAAGAVAERRPVWTAVLCLVAASAAVLALRGRRRRHLAERAAQQAAAALQEATRTALDALEAPAEECPRSRVPTVDGMPADDRAPVDYEALDPDGFEQAVAALCERDGCSSVEVVGGAGDLGADVVAVDPQGRRVIVQCKRYGDGNRVGSQELQRFGGTCFTVHEADVAAVVTTSEFTAPAVEYAAQCGIVCVDGQALRAWSEGTGPTPWSLGHQTPTAP
ncbi:restriction endonuclease [Streptomyces sp. NPDC021356]|uniref:restriction endonuclease n=1 Tax=Streptomyces sp. NPDC021356 TaxID=3154900 RepID=UPI0033C1DA53